MAHRVRRSLVALTRWSPYREHVPASHGNVAQPAVSSLVLRLGMSLLLLLSLLWAPTVWSRALEWSFAMEPGAVARLEIRRADGSLVGRFLTSDNSENNQFGWRPDSNTEDAAVSGSLEQLWLGNGRYTFQVIRPGGTDTRPLSMSRPAARILLVEVPSGTREVVAWHLGQQGEMDGLADAVARVGSNAVLWVGPGSWLVLARGPWGEQSTEVGPSQRRAKVSPPGEPGPRDATPDHRGLVALAMLPAALLLTGLALLGLFRFRRNPGLWWAVGAGALLALLAMSSVLSNPSTRILNADPPILDPVGSLAVLAGMSDSLPRLSDVTTLFRFPEGASWLPTGPTWIGYLLPVLSSTVLGTVAAFNLGVALGIIGLVAAVWALCRALGTSQGTAVLAGLLTALGPMIFDELDANSLDRTTLFLVPLFFAFLHMATRRPGWRWPLAAGATLAAVCHGQVYFGIYLASACPLLVLPRLLGPGWRARFGRLSLLALVAALLASPALLVLHGTAAESAYSASTSVRDALEDPLHPVDQREARYFLSRFARQANHDADMPTTFPRDRLLAASAESLTLPEALLPSQWFPGRGFYWPLVIMVLLLLRRRLALLAAWDVLVLLIYSLGPFLRIQPQQAGLLLPDYLNILFIPGFEQLKNTHRFALMAASISVAPLALGLDALFSRLSRSSRLSRVHRSTVYALLGLLALGLSFVGLHWPRTREIPRVDALDVLDSAAAVAIPFQVPLPIPMLEVAVQHHLSLVNEPPYPTIPGPNPHWSETNPLLNRLAWLSGSTRPHRFLALGKSDEAVHDLLEQGVRYVILFRGLLPGADAHHSSPLSDDIQVFMDQQFRRVADDGNVVAWDLGAIATE